MGHMDREVAVAMYVAVIRAGQANDFEPEDESEAAERGNAILMACQKAYEVAVIGFSSDELDEVVAAAYRRTNGPAAGRRVESALKEDSG